MPTYTILGATGNVGGSILKLLHERSKDDKIQVNAYIRSRSKLVKQMPTVETDERTKIVEGNLNDIPRLASVVAPGVDVVFVATGAADNIPGVRIAQESAQAVVAALSHARSLDHTVRLPKLVFLSSASVNPIFTGKTPFLVHMAVKRAFSYVYADLAYAEEYMRLHKSWLDATFVQPGALAWDVQRGHALSLDECSPFVSYLDLAAGMIEIGESGTYDWQRVSVNAISKDVKFEPKVPQQIARGLVWHFFPFLYNFAIMLRLV